MIFLQTPNIYSLGHMSGLFNSLKRKCNFFNSSIFWHFMPQLFDRNITYHIAFWYVMISELGGFFTWIKSQHILRFPIFIHVCFILFYTLLGIYMPFLAIIVCKLTLLHKFLLLSTKNCLFFSILVFLILNVHKGSLI